MSFTYTTTDKGIIDFQVDNTHMYCNVESKVITVNGTNYTLKILDNLIQLNVSTTKTYNTGKTVIETISSKYCPPTLRIIPLVYTADVILYVTSSGEITFENRTSSSFKATLIPLLNGIPYNTHTRVQITLCVLSELILLYTTKVPLGFNTANMSSDRKGSRVV